MDARSGAAAEEARGAAGARFARAPDLLGLVPDVFRGLQTSLAILLETPRDQAAELRRHLRAPRGHDRWCVPEDGRHERGLASARERPVAGRHLVQHDAEREDVGARVDGAALDLLGRHVRHRAHDDALTRLGDGLEFRSRVCSHLGQAEVEHLHAAVARHHDVGGLQIAMHDALLVSGRQRFGDLHRQREDLPHRKSGRQHLPVQRLAFHQLHRQEMHAFRLLDGIDGDDVRMVEGGDGARLSSKPIEAGRIEGHRRGQHLQGHVAAERAYRWRDRPHPSRPPRADGQFHSVQDECLRRVPCARKPFPGRVSVSQAPISTASPLG